MVTCPHCQQDIESTDFGLIDCPHCESAIFVDLSGNAHIKEDAELETKEENQDIKEEESEQMEEVSFEEQSEEKKVIEEKKKEKSFQENPAEDEKEEKTDLNEWESDFQKSLKGDKSYTKISFPFMDETKEEEENVFFIRIEKISFSEDRKKLHSILSQTALNIDVDSVLKEISKEQVIISDLKPAQALLLIHKLHQNGFKVSWKGKSS